MCIRDSSQIRPDILLKNDSEIVPFDCKYKLYESKKLSTSDIYQTFLYAYALGDVAHPRAGIIYPASGSGVKPRLGVSRMDGPSQAEISGMAIDLVQILESRTDPGMWNESLSVLRRSLGSVLTSTKAMEEVR